MKDFKKYFSANSAIMLLIDVENGNIADSNLAAQKFYGYSHKKMLSLNISDLNVLPKNIIKKQIIAFNNKKIFHKFFKHKTADKTIKDIQVFASPVLIDDRKYNFAIIQDVTELKIKEKENNRFSRIIENAIPFIGIANAKREVFYFNQSMRKAFAVPKNADMSKYKVFDFYTDRGKKSIKQAFSEIQKNGFWKGENEMQSLNGKIYQVIQTIVLIKDEQGNPQYTSSVAIDVTQQKQAEQKIANTATRYKTLLDTASDGIHVINSRLKVVEANDAFCKMLGYPQKEILKLSIQDWDVQWNKKELQKRFNGLINESAIFETRHKRKDGTVIDVEINATGIVIDGENYLYASSRDISERKIAEEKIKSSESKFRALLDNSFDAIGVEKNGLWEMCNPATLKLFGYSQNKELIGKSVLDVIAPEERERVKLNMSNRLAGRSAPDSYTTIGLKKDGSRFDLEGSIAKFNFNNKIQTMAILRDITERRLSEEKIKLSESKFRALLDNSFDAIGVHINGIWEICNPPALKLFGYSSADELIGKPILNVIAPEEHERIKNFVQARIENIDAPSTYITRGLKKGGEVFDLEVSLSNFFQNNQFHVIVTLRDITERRQLEISLKQSEENLKQGELLGKFGYWKVNLDTQVFQFSPGASKIYGIEESEIPWINIKKLRLPEYNTLMDEAMYALINKNKKYNLEYRIKRKSDNKTIGIHIISKYSKNDRVIFGSIQDITERMNAEQALTISEEKFRHLITDLTIGVVVYSPNGEILFNNQKALSLLGLKSKHLIGKTLLDPQWNVIHEDGSDFPVNTHPASEAIKSKKIIKDVIMGVYRPFKKDRVWLMVNAMPELAEDGSVRQVIVTFYDLSELRKKDEEVHRLNKELKELAAHLQRLRVDERNKLAKEVHDKLAQRLVGMKFQIEFLNDCIKKDIPEHSNKIALISGEISDMLKDFGSIYKEVNPTLIDDLEIYDAIDSLIIDFRKRNNQHTDFLSNTENEVLPHNIKWILYKTVEECLDNALMHANANNISVKLFKHGNFLKLEIIDDGKGFDISTLDSKHQIGIIEMRENVNSIGGKIIIDSKPGYGTAIKVKVSI